MIRHTVRAFVILSLLSATCADEPTLDTLFDRLKEEPDNPVLHEKIASAYEEKGDLSRAVEYYTKTVYLMKDLAVKQKHDYEKAEEEARRYEKGHFSEEDLFPTELERVRLTELRDRADEKYQRWRETTRGASSHLYHLGVLHMEGPLEDPGTANRFFESALDLNPENYRAAENLATMHYYQKNYGKAEKFLKKIPFTMRSYREMFILGDIRMEEKDNPGAEKFYNEGVALCIILIKSSYFHGLDLVERKTREFARALAFYEQKIGENLRDVPNLFRYGAIYQLLGDYAAAREMYVKILRLPYGYRDEDPWTESQELEALKGLRPAEQEDLHDLYHLLLIIYRKTDQNAQDDLLTEKLTDYYLSGAVALSLEAYTEESEELLEKAVLICPESFRVYLEGGKVHLNRLDYKAAYRFFDKAVELEPASGEACFWRGFASLKSGIALLEGNHEGRAECAFRTALDDFIIAGESAAPGTLEKERFRDHWVDLLLHLGRLSMEKEDYFAASSFYQSGLITGTPQGTAECHYGLGRAYKEMEKRDFAVTYFHIALNAFLSLAETTENEGRRKDYFIRIHEIHLELADLQENMGNPEAAEAHRGTARAYWQKSLAPR